jgi:hypothetical protein
MHPVRHEGIERSPVRITEGNDFEARMPQGEWPPIIGSLYASRKQENVARTGGGVDHLPADEA